MKLYDSRFDNLEIEEGSFEDFTKKTKFNVVEQGMPEGSYVTLVELQEEFEASRYQILNALKDIGAKPIGIKNNIVNGKRMRGANKIVYDSSVIDQIYEATPIEEILAEARKILEE